MAATTASSNVIRFLGPSSLRFCCSDPRRIWPSTCPLTDVTSVSGHVDGQILRGSLQQKRKEEGPKNRMTFEEAVVAAIDFHGALTGTGSYAPPPEARGGKHKGAGVGPSPAYS